MKKLILLMLLISILSTSGVFAVFDSDTGLLNITFNYPFASLYNASGSGDSTAVMFTLNATVSWTAPMNITNLTFVLVSGATTTRFSNNTINGSRISPVSGDFTINVSSSDIAEGSYTVTIEVQNSTDGSNVGNQINSSSITFVIDRTLPSVTLERPQSGASQSPSNGVIPFDYTPTETNLGNCTFVPTSGDRVSSTSGTTTPNVTTGIINTFRRGFTSDLTFDWYVTCEDLAGNNVTSATRTINVLTTGFTNVVDASGKSSSGGKEYYVEGGKTLSVSSTPSKGLPPAPKSGFVQQYAWVVLLLIAVGVIYLIFKWNPKG